MGRRRRVRRLSKDRGAAAEAGADLAACKALGERVFKDGVHGRGGDQLHCPSRRQADLASPTMKSKWAWAFRGEGQKRMALASASEIVEHLTQAIDDELKPAKGQPALLHVNGFSDAADGAVSGLCLTRQFWTARGGASSVRWSATLPPRWTGRLLRHPDLLDDEMIRL